MYKVQQSLKREKNGQAPKQEHPLITEVKAIYLLSTFLILHQNYLLHYEKPFSQ